MTRITAALGLLLACMACSREADFSGMVPQPVILPAESYRTEILAIDRLAFRSSAVDDARRTELASELEGLAKRIVAGSDSRFLKLESLELRALAGRARRLGEGRSSESMQNEWMRIRNNLFEDRAWFARSAADLPPVEPAIAAPVTANPHHDARGDALHLIAPTQGWMIYELTDDRLRVAFWDGLGERPPGFERTDGKIEPMLNVVVLTHNR